MALPYDDPPSTLTWSKKTPSKPQFNQGKKFPNIQQKHKIEYKNNQSTEQNTQKNPNPLTSPKRRLPKQSKINNNQTEINQKNETLKK
jgi:hypothetical protein